MPSNATPSPTHRHPSKRARQSSPDKGSPSSLNSANQGPSPTNESHNSNHNNHNGSHPGKAGQSSSFRNVSACNRCRLRKNRCDQKLPSCASCEKANVACVGYDPITKREIPRSYVFYLETRVQQLEALLQANKIEFAPAENLEFCSRPSVDPNSVRSPTNAAGRPVAVPAKPELSDTPDPNNRDTSKLQKLVSSSGMGSVTGTSNPRYLGATSGVSFARVVFAAVQSSVSDQRSSSDKTGIRPYRPANGTPMGVGSGTSMRDSFFGLHTKPTIHPIPFPDRETALGLVDLYFQHSNCQIPVLHRGEFMNMFDAAYAGEGRVRGPRELYMLNMVFAIGAGIIMGDSAKHVDQAPTVAEGKRKKGQPEEYHASAIVHLEACLGCSNGGLEELQAVLLLGNFALLRPVPPGLWYIIGVAVRLAVDLGMHYEDGKDLNAAGSDPTGPKEGGGGDPKKPPEFQPKERGRREYVRDLRRRLWWCTYSFDRLVSTCVGRPFGISDQVITTEFPTLLDDHYITPTGLLEPAHEASRPTYKLVAYHYFRLRLLQSEILQVLQYRQTQIARTEGQNQRNPYIHTQLPSPFLAKFDSFRAWRIDIDKRLYEWKSSAPTQQETGVKFCPDFLDLNYWQAVIMLYRQSLSVPALFEGEYNTSNEVNSPSVFNVELREDEERVYLKVAEAGQRILRLYRQLHLMSLVNYTYLATHHLFMAGISYLYAIWHSPVVRSRLSMDEVDFTVLAATSVLSDLIDKCPPAEACRDAFDRTAKATVKMANSNGGFGPGANNPGLRSKRSRSKHDENKVDWSPRSESELVPNKARRHMPRTSATINRVGGFHSEGSLTDPMSGTAGSTPTALPQLQTANAFRRPVVNNANNIKSEADGFSLMRSVPSAPMSAASAGSDLTMTPPAMDASLMASPTMRNPTPPTGSIASPTTSLTPQASAQFTPMQTTPGPSSAATSVANFGFMPPVPGTTASMAPPTTAGPINFSDLQGMEFLQSLQGGVADVDTEMDLGFGLGWEGMHHDFSDGQQVDLFDGFFFGGQQGGGGAGGSNGLGGL
ncbi:Positive regulator of purine utilization [Zalerion maritima]|uniref:Positive regulator of purine utilization n=1 Tax=Zalerion maritima TaxID=339359 RepID=A0AAD5RLF9_9PEZI|nr:Positive regulator of purine utilization [Zalerion maritima]